MNYYVENLDSMSVYEEKLNNLNDCLFELFDKFNIPEITDQYEYPKFGWICGKSIRCGLSIKIVNIFGVFHVVKNEVSLFGQIYKELCRITPMVEKRIGCMIEISWGSMPESHSYYISINPTNNRQIYSIPEPFINI